MGPGDTEENFSFPLIEMLDQIFEETLDEVNNHNKTMAGGADLKQLESQVKVNIYGESHYNKDLFAFPKCVGDHPLFGSFGFEKKF